MAAIAVVHAQVGVLGIKHTPARRSMPPAA
jgi:hypothetical protein